VGFRRWLAADAQHARAWEEICVAQQPFSALAAPLRKSLVARHRPQKRGAKAAGIVACTLLAITVIGLAGRVIPLRGLVADYSTRLGEGATITLPDRSVVHLNTKTVLDVVYDKDQRLLLLREGEIALQSGPGHDPRPLRVRTVDGDFQALGTRFTVRVGDDSTKVSVQQSAVAVEPAEYGARQVVNAGQQMLVRHGRSGPVQAGGMQDDAWVDGVIVVDDLPLSELARELQRYHVGHLGVDPAIAARRITGTFRVNDLPATLAAITQTLPVRVNRIGPWWVDIVPVE
jgi:transmembrane sensor